MTDARSLLRQLAASNVPFVTIGSTGLALLHPSHFTGTRLPDVDVLLARGMDTLLAFVHFARSRNAPVTSWGEPFELAHRNNALEGRFYVRAQFDGGLQCDATYENARLDADVLIGRAQWVDGIPICPEEELWFSKILADPGKARRFASEHGLEIPSSALERARVILGNQTPAQ
ncbi:hypothetical protein BO221_29080 [Archangium sp. Cb G35]|uniref:hypothetical protein n=1 Tax=Archangium sp. Cb G35 TaxID=1920190 RepID=UPI000936FAEC|nr:hypothetical protein [Archangium sp. Cb G35]OJT20949.1 hypothetical protein BO221_29080 [Archangium sp. Cb G35]